MADSELTVAVTGPTGMFGFGLMPLLQRDERIAQIVRIARRPFDASARGWTKMTRRQGDVRDRAALEEASRGADEVVHLAFTIMRAASRETIQRINVDGTLNALRATAVAGARRFVYAASVAAYGFHRDNPVGMTEDWLAQPAAHLFYVQEKAEIERLLGEQASGPPGLGIYLLRPPVVLRPDAVGATAAVPGPIAPLVRRVVGVVIRPPFPVVTLPVPVQVIHEEDVGQALLLCITGAWPPDAYNITGDGVLSGAAVLREFRLAPIPASARLRRAAARVRAALPFAPPFAGWAEAVSHPAIMDAPKAKRKLSWRPRFSSLQAPRITLKAR